MANITINNFSKISAKLSKSDYWDFKLSKDGGSNPTIYNGEELYTDSLIAYIDFDNPKCIGENGVIYSADDYKWGEAVNKGLLLKNIGLTGVDNGKIVINQDNYKDVVKNSVLTIEENDVRLQLTKVGGNTGLYEYPINMTDEIFNNIGTTAELRGGFYQGFFKSGRNYQVLPLPEKEITYEFLLKPEQHISTKDNVLNKIEDYDNDGIFFYLGLRAENKFSYEYTNFNGIFSEKSKEGVIYPIEKLKTSGNIDPSNKNFSEIDTDNKYLLFNRTKTGIRASDFDPEVMYTVRNDKPTDKSNKYITHNRTTEGLRVGNSLGSTGNVDSEVIYDTYLNQIAFRIKKDGRIGYRTIIHDRSSFENYSIKEEYSEIPIANNYWYFITVRMVVTSMNKKFKLLFYVNGKLVLTSKELPKLKLKKMSIHDELQEGVPYNISLGGGTQGLIDMVGFNEKYKREFILPIERCFAGSFIGKISQFKIYHNDMAYDKILNNAMYIKNKLDIKMINSMYRTIYYGTSNIELTEFFQIKSLKNKIVDYNNMVDTIELNTGIINNVFMFAVPTYKKLDDIKDVDSFIKDENFKNTYIENIIKINDKISYKLYTMKNAIPYNSNHKHVITFKI